MNPRLLWIIFTLGAVFIAGQGLAEPIDQWQGRNLFPQGSPLRIYYGNGLFLAVGEFGAIYTSVVAGENGILLQSESIPNTEISTFPSSMDFGTVNVGSSSSVNLTITNSGPVNVLIQRLAISGPNAIDFIIQNENCTGPALLPSQICAIQIVFSPPAPGSKTATLSISSNDPNTPTRTVPLNGTGSGFSPGTNESYCFISFSTLGSELEEYIGMLRTFRDIFLMESKLGRMAVALYYRQSSTLVHFIARHDFLREVVQVGLIPLVILSYLALHTSPAEKAFFFALLTGFVIARWLMMRRSFR
jgi:hypothetical protein